MLLNVGDVAAEGVVLLQICEESRSRSYMAPNVSF